MMCKDCEHFKILMEPLRSGGDLWDLGQAKCEKYDLVCDFPSHRKLNALKCCVEEHEGGQNEL